MLAATHMRIVILTSSWNISRPPPSSPVRSGKTGSLTEGFTDYGQSLQKLSYYLLPTLVDSSKIAELLPTLGPILNTRDSPYIHCIKWQKNLKSPLPDS